VYLDVLDGHNGAGKGHVRVDLDDHSVHPVWEDILEVLREWAIERIGKNMNMQKRSTPFLCFLAFLHYLYNA